MIGNDVVDLLDEEARVTERTPAFDARVFTASERERILAAEDAPRMRWLMWAAKEAAYKLARKRDAGLGFSPRRFEVGPFRVVDEHRRPATRLSGRVRMGGLRVECEWISAPDFVHALCREPALPPPQCTAVQRFEPLEGLPGDPGVLVRRLAVREIARTLGVPEDTLRIVKRDRIPFLYLGGREAGADLSLSHHGSVVAFACWFPPRQELAGPEGRSLVASQPPQPSSADGGLVP